jgi:homoserine dehydrogenase
MQGEMRERETLSSRCRIALLGLGTVGAAVARRLTAPDADAIPRGLQLTHICDRRAEQKRQAVPAAGVAWTTRVDDILQSDADVIVEAIGGVSAVSAFNRHSLLEAV